MDEATKQAVLSLLRTILIAAGSLVTAKGLADSGTVNTVIGAAMVIIPAAWGIWDKFQAQKKITVAVQAGVATPIPENKATAIDPAQAQRIVKTYAAAQQGTP